MSLRDALWESGHDETVEVNQRALIDKVLARYSGEFTVFRELLQNSDDARSEEVEIRFETKPADGEGEGSKAVVVGGDGELPDLKTVMVHRWKFKNNGMLFRDEDWSRLKKIAEGNPDEEKIGAFGVGFYSLFSVTDDPFVTSGQQWMAFYWKDKKDQLYARRGTLPTDVEGKEWTTFEMPLREPAPMPVPFDLIRFLTSSITFMTHLHRISVYLDDKRLARLEKGAGQAHILGVPRGLNPRTEQKTMTINTIRSTPVHIRAEVLKWVYSAGSEKKRIIPAAIKIPKPSFGGLFSSILSGLSGQSTPQRGATPLPPPEPEPKSNLLDINESSVSLTVYSAEVSTKLDRKFSAALQRSTKKEPPSKLRYELIYTGKPEYDASVQDDSKYPSSTGSVFQGLRADLGGDGTTRIFIGHSTAQTTGIGGHMASRFIPTVERESIDFMDRHIAVWNKELLQVGGTLARSAYEFELQDIKSAWDKIAGSDSSSNEKQMLIQRAIHVLNFFTFHPSTPSAEVSQLLGDAFFGCGGNLNLPILSTRGVKNCPEVRLPEASLSAFVKNLPVVPQDLITGAKRMVVDTLQQRGFLNPITLDDVLSELNTRPLPANEMVACLKWWSELHANSNSSNSRRFADVQRSLVNAAILITVTPGQNDKLIQLSSIRTYITPKSIVLTDGPLPDHVLPPEISKELDIRAMQSVFGWNELPLLEWLAHLCSLEGKPDKSEFDLSVSPVWAERVLSVLTRGWPSLRADEKEKLVLLLKDKSCIPTSGGMKVPAEAYFSTVNIFEDLPTVTLPSQNMVRGTMEKFLQALGVRKHVELQVLFNRMIKTNQWTVSDLMKYLASVRSTLSHEEFQKLKATAAFSKELDGTESKDKPNRFAAHQLYEPLDIFRKLRLPVLDWGTKVKWRSSSDEAKFLFDLGLRRQPPLGVLLTLCTDQDPQFRSVALHYFLDNITTKYPDYTAYDFSSLAYIPAIHNGKSCLAKIKEVFSDPQWAALGFFTLEPAYQKEASKLQVEAHPSASQLANLLKTQPPKDIAEATLWFSIISSRVSDFSKTQLEQLSSTSFVPTNAGYLPPSRCYIGTKSGDSIHAALFTFVNFGVVANSFLVACGAKLEPSMEEIARMLLESPAKYYKLCGDPERYLQELRNLAINIKQLSSGTLTLMKRAPILLGMQYKSKANGKEEDVDEEDWDATYALKKAQEIVLVDDTNAYQAFKNVLWTSPQEDLIEVFYKALGSQKLSMHVREECQCTAEILDSKKAVETQKLVLERLPLFLYEHTHSKTKVTMNWLSTPGNFVVKTFGKITVSRHLNFGDLRLSKGQEVSAISRRTAAGYGPIQLWVAGNTQVDMYDVAMSLNKQLFDAPKANDALLLMTILSTDLKSLQRRGYNVSRIMKKQKQAPLPPAAAGTVLPEEPSSMKPGMVSTPAAAGPSSKATGQQPPALPPKPDGIANSPFNPRNWKMASDFLGAATGPGGLLGPSLAQNQNRLRDEPVQQGLRPTSTPTSNPTTSSTSAISHNIDLAIEACKQESGDVLKNRQAMHEVKETVNESYCDVSGMSENLVLAGEMGSVKVYLADTVPPLEAQTFLNDNKDALRRFIQVLVPLSGVYDLPVTRIHIFYDVSGGLIAFNRNASLFFNLRFFQSWHDAEVQSGQLNNAFISWYFTLAHEIAHNIVKPHNSEHEFYFAAIAEKHLMSLGKLLTA